MDFDGDGVPDVALYTSAEALAFHPSPKGYWLALYLRDAERGSWRRVGTMTSPVVLEQRSGPLRRDERGFERVSRVDERTVEASAAFQASDGNAYRVSLTARLQTWEDREVFALRFTWLNMGPVDAYSVTIASSVALEGTGWEAYLFAPGVFYGDNQMEVPPDGPQVNVPTLAKLRQRGYYTFLANRAMLPLVANWDGRRMVMLATTETSTVGEEPVRNSLGWRLAGDRMEQHTWTHGYLYNRYVGPDAWTERIDADTEAKTSIGRGESLTKEVLLAAATGDVWMLFDYYRVFRERFRANAASTIYESVTASLRTRSANLKDFYNQRQGFLAHYAGDTRQMAVSYIGGVPAGYGVLRLADQLKDEEMRRMARSTLDFVADTSLSPSGFGYTWYKEGAWGFKGLGGSVGIPARMISEATYFMLLAYDYERAQGREHANWRRYAVSNLDAISTVWRQHGELGYEYSDQTPTLVRRGSPAGILWVAALAEGRRILGAEGYGTLAEEMAQSYAPFVEGATLYGGELDQGFSPDASAAAHAMAAYFTLFEQTKNQRYLMLARRGADVYSTFVMGQNILWRPRSYAGARRWTSVGLSTSGVRNNHLSSGLYPGFTEFLVKLYAATGEKYYLNVAVDQFQASLEGYARSDGDFGSIPGDIPVKKGFGFDWILHSDWVNNEEEGYGRWFGGLMHVGFIHQVYLLAIGYLDVWSQFGDVVVDTKARHIASLNSLLIEDASFVEGMRWTAQNVGDNPETYKVHLTGLHPGIYQVRKEGRPYVQVMVGPDGKGTFPLDLEAGASAVWDVFPVTR